MLRGDLGCHLGGALDFPDVDAGQASQGKGRRAGAVPLPARRLAGQPPAQRPAVPTPGSRQEGATAPRCVPLRRRGRQGNPLSPATVRLTLTVLSMALDAAVKEGSLARNVTALVDQPRMPRRERSVWEATEAAAFTRVADEDRLAGYGSCQVRGRAGGVRSAGRSHV